MSDPNALNPDLATTREGTNDVDARPKTPQELGADAASSDKPADAVAHESDAQPVDTTNPNAQSVLNVLGEGWSFGPEPDDGLVEFTNGDITVAVGEEHLADASHVNDIAATIKHTASTADAPEHDSPEGDEAAGDDEDAVGDDEEREDEEE